METIPEEDYLQISGLQHYRFCPRQWALIHLEQQWTENLRTTEGVLLHERPIRRDSGKAVGTCSRSGPAGVFAQSGPAGSLRRGGIPPGSRRAAGRTGGTGGRPTR